MLMQAIHSKTKEINTIKVSYLDEGPAGTPIILFIHGFPLNKTMWSPQIEELKSTYRVIAYDVRGHGDTEIGTANFSIELFVDDLICFMDSLKIEKVTLCGLSMGGYIALNAALHFPKRFESLVLCDTNCVADLPEVAEKRMNTIENIKKEGLKKYADESVKNLFAPLSLKMGISEVVSVRDMVLGTLEPTIFRTLYALANRKETCSRLSEIQLPTLIMVGKEDKITPLASAEQIRKGITNATLIVLEGAGHLSNMENPRQFNQNLISHIKIVYRALESKELDDF